MSEVKRFNPAEYLPGMFPHESGNYVRFSSFGRMKQDRDAQRLRADTAEAALDNYIKQAVLDTAHRQALLAAAEQRIAELVGQSQLLKRLLGDAKANLNPTGRLAKAIDAALNPEAESHDGKPAIGSVVVVHGGIKAFVKAHHKDGLIVGAGDGYLVTEWSKP